jgi:hypothetical protein
MCYHFNVKGGAIIKKKIITKVGNHKTENDWFVCKKHVTSTSQNKMLTV